MGSERFTSRDTLPYGMVTDRVRFLLEYRLGLRGVVDHRHVVSIDVDRAHKWDTHHSELVTYATACFNA